ncbi:MAG TPA: phage major capsid protein [Nitrosopumilaceae archaeon]|nr:phage major capsid protein [Nitrosopumilaceae archaeon]
MATFDDYIQSLTLHSLAPKVADGVLGGNFLTHRLLMNSKSYNGETMKFAHAYRKNTSGQWYDGMDTLSTSRINTRVRLSFEPRWFSQSVVIAGTDLDVNSTRAGIIKLLTTEMEWSQQSMADTIGNAFYTLQAGKAPLSVLDISDDGTDVATYGGVSRTTYTSLNGQRNASGGVMTVSQLATLFDDCAVGTLKPTLAVGSEAVWTIYEGLLQPTVQMNINVTGYAQSTYDGIVSSKQALGGDLGFDSLYFRGIPVVRDEKSASQTFFMFNEPTIAWYSLPSSRWNQVNLGSSTIEGPYAKGPSTSFKFYWSGLREPTAQDAEVGFFKIGGQLISPNPRLQGQLTGITG